MISVCRVSRTRSATERPLLQQHETKSGIDQPDITDMVPPASSQPEAVAPQPQEPSQNTKARPRASFDEDPIARKVFWLSAATAAWAGVAGFAAATFGWGVLGMALGAAIIALIAAIAGRRFVAGPVEDLAMQVRRLNKGDAGRPLSPRNLPRHRRDEVGRIATVVHDLAAGAIRHHTEARQLRRTLDDRIAKATRQATAHLQHVAMRDPMTDLANRRFLDEHLDDLVQSCRDSHTDLICVAIDLDHFKAVNDKLGHAAGDTLIQFAGKLLTALVRDEDFAARIGGDEFVVFMPGCPIERARQFTHTTQMMFNEHVMLTLPDELGVDMSFGVASLQRDNAVDGADLIRMADEQLYAAKEAGKGVTKGA